MRKNRCLRTYSFLTGAAPPAPLRWWALWFFGESNCSAHVQGVSQSLCGRTWEEDTLTVSAAVFKIGTNEISGILRVTVSKSFIADILKSAQPCESGHTLVVDRDGSNLFADDESASLPKEIMTLADSASFSAHKFFGLCGSGALYKRRGLVLEPLIHGGGSDAIYRSGTPTVSLNAATAEALRLSLENREQDLCRLKALNSCLREELERYPLVRINSPGEAIPHILNLSVKGVRGGDFQQALNERGVCVSVKSACSVPNTPSRAVFAVSRDRNNALSSWRISMCIISNAGTCAPFTSGRSCWDTTVCSTVVS